MKIPLAHNEHLSPAGGEDEEYTGQRHAAGAHAKRPEESGAEAGLYFYNARWRGAVEPRSVPGAERKGFDPEVGRFTCPRREPTGVQADTIIPEPGNPLAWDRYAYANNNPLYYTDPSGHKACEGFESEENESVGKCIYAIDDIHSDLGQGRPTQAAIHDAIIIGGIDISSADGMPQYSPELIPDGETIDNSIMLGPSAFSSPGNLMAVIYHETVHATQYIEGRAYDYSEIWGAVGWAMNELEAYDMELIKADYFGLTIDEINKVTENRGSIYNNWLNDDMKMFVDQGIYYLDGIDPCHARNSCNFIYP